MNLHIQIMQINHRNKISHGLGFRSIWSQRNLKKNSKEKVWLRKLGTNWNGRWRWRWRFGVETEEETASVATTLLFWFGSGSRGGVPICFSYTNNKLRLWKWCMCVQWDFATCADEWTCQLNVLVVNIIPYCFPIILILAI